MRWRRRNEDLDRELKAHLELEAEEQEDGGLDPEQARYAARRAFGNVTSVKEDAREEWGWRQRLDSVIRDTRFALRTFRRGTGSYVFAIAVLAVGIGMTTALFSLVYAVLLRPLPFPDQDALQVVWKAQPGKERLVELAYPELADLTDNIEALESVALMPTTAYGNGRVVQGVGLEPRTVNTAPVSSDFFRTLGVQPQLGRDFPSLENEREQGPAVILSDALWREYFSADPSILGRPIQLDGSNYEVIGVMGPEIDFPRGAKLWLPLPRSTDRDSTWLQAIVRVKPGYSDAQVRTELRSLFQRQEEEYPQFYPKTQLPVVTRLPAYWTGATRLQLSLSLGASVLLLIAACVTAGNLFLSRALARKQEIATRTSLGASPRQVFSQFAAEGLAAGVIAGSVGVTLAWALVRLLVAWAPSEIPRIADAGIRGEALIFASSASLLTALACSLAPCWLATQLNVSTMLREGGARLTSGRGGRLIQAAFTTVQTAVTVVLLAASLLIAVSFHAMLSEDIGFANRDAVTMHLNPRGPQFNAASQDAFYTELLKRLRESPAVTSAGAILLRPLAGPIGWDTQYRLAADANVPAKELPTANFQVVTPGYFETVGTPLLEGRDFNERDGPDAEQSVIIGHSLAEHLRQAGQEPLGSRIRLYYGDPWWTVVGVVADARYRGVRLTRDDLYLNYLQTNVPVRYPVVRGSGTAAELAELVRREAARLDPTLAVAEVQTIEQLVESDTAQQRFNMTLLLLFAAGAILLAAAGVYSVVAENLTEQRCEIAIRMALGADRHRLIRKLVAATTAFVVLGALFGVCCVLVLGRSVADLLYAVTPEDPIILGSVVAFVLFVSAFAAFIPAWSITGREPRTVLQAD